MVGVTRDDFSGGGSYACAMKVLVVSAVALLVVAGCSGGGDGSASSTTTVAATTVASQAGTTLPEVVTTTVPVVTTVSPVPSSTAPVVTTAPPVPTTAPLAVATTAPLPTDMDGLTDEQIVAIDRDFREGFRLLYAALENPSDDAAVQAAYAYTTGFDRDTTTPGIFSLYFDNNRRLVRIPTVAPSFFIEQGPSLVSGPDHVALFLCEVAPYEVFEIGTGPDGSDTLVRGGAVTQRIGVELRFDDGIWKRSSVSLEGEWDGAIRCP
jgi:hypothetical protein